MGQAVVSHRRFPMLHFARPVRRARVDGLDQYLLLLMREGMWQGAAGEAELTLRPGEVGLFDMARPVANLVTDSSSLRVMLPRDAVDALVPGGALAAHGARLSGAAAAVLATFMEALLQNLPALEIGQAVAMERARMELAAAWRGISRRDGWGGSRRCWRTRGRGGGFQSWPMGTGLPTRRISAGRSGGRSVFRRGSGGRSGAARGVRRASRRCTRPGCGG
jgi:hypothetical protein